RCVPTHAAQNYDAQRAFSLGIVFLSGRRDLKPASPCLTAFASELPRAPLPPIRSRRRRSRRAHPRRGTSYAYSGGRRPAAFRPRRTEPPCPASFLAGHRASVREKGFETGFPLVHRVRL